MVILELGTRFWPCTYLESVKAINTTKKAIQRAKRHVSAGRLARIYLSEWTFSPRRKNKARNKQARRLSTLLEEVEQSGAKNDLESTLIRLKRGSRREASPEPRGFGLL